MAAFMRAMADRDKNRFLVRMPDGMRVRIAEAAKENARSMNAEIVARLERTFVEGDKAVAQIESAFADLEARIDHLSEEIEANFKSLRAASENKKAKVPGA